MADAEPLSFWIELVHEYQPEMTIEDVVHILETHTSWLSGMATEVIKEQIEDYMMGEGIERHINGNGS